MASHDVQSLSGASGHGKGTLGRWE